MEAYPEKSISKDEISSKPATSAEKEKGEKVVIRLRHIGDAPILKNKTFLYNGKAMLAEITLNVRKLLNLGRDQSLFFYIDSTFAPTPDATLESLASCYAVKSANKEVLELQYSITPAYG